MTSPVRSPDLAPGPFGFLRRFAVSLKLALILFLALLLQVPLVLVHGLMEERQRRQTEAVAEITQTWGADQTLTGPILMVPYVTTTTSERNTIIDGRAVRSTEQRRDTGYVHILPEHLEIAGDLEPSTRKRGIHQAVVYRGTLKLSGRFGAPELQALELEASALQWEKAWLALAITDLRGSQQKLDLEWDGRRVSLEPGTRIEQLPSGLHGRLGLSADGTGANAAFACTFSVNGSGSLRVVPVGKETLVTLSSPWPDPSFDGAFLPAERSVGDSGFSARWLASYYGRNYPQLWHSREEGAPERFSQLQGSAFGVSLMRVVDNYRMVERAIKYGVLFIVFLFTAFFLFEVLCGLRLHSLHYLLVGAAMCLFYLALLSTSEFLPFALAYSASALASTALIGGYCKSILHSGKRAWVVTTAVTLIYGLLFFILRMQDYALLVGSFTLFVALAFVMYSTRRVDWSGQFTPGESIK